MPPTFSKQKECIKWVPETEPKFAVDLTLGKLAKWLRLLGFDTISLKMIDDHTLVSLVREKRILLTRNRHIAKKGTQVILLEADEPDVQLATIFGCIDVTLNPARYFSLCTLCNTPVKPIDKNVVRDKVPDYVWATHDRFAKCPGCERIYWKGSHPEKFKEQLEKLIGLDL